MGEHPTKAEIMQQDAEAAIAAMAESHLQETVDELNLWKPSPIEHRASVVEDRSQRMKAAKHRGKYEIKWNGMSGSFTLFKRQLEGHLLQVGAGHLFEKDFVASYK